MTDVGFTYELGRHGWSSASLRVGAETAQLRASYLSDALGDLINATRAIAQGAREVQVGWAMEPGEYRWVISADGAQLNLRILWFPDGPWSRRPDEDGEVRLEGRCDARAFCVAIAREARRILDEYGPDEYRVRWVGDDFPEAALTELEQAL